MSEFLKIEIIKKGVFVEDLEHHIKMKFISIKNGMQILGAQTVSRMTDIVKMNKKRKEANNKPAYRKLENAIKMYVEDKGRIIGIGKKRYLDLVAPHWYVIEHGGMSGVAKSGKSVPGYFGNFNPPASQYKGSSMGKEAFTYAPNNAPFSNASFFMKPTSPIMPMHYILKTRAWLRTIIKVHFYNWTGVTKIVDKMKKI